MIDPGAVVLVILAAGRGSRLGGGKLVCDLAGRQLGMHAASMLAAVPFRAHIAVCRDSMPSLSALGFQCVNLTPEDAPLSRSIALGIAAAQEYQPEAAMIALADMPFVPEAHIASMLKAFDGDRLATGGETVHPPALFAALHFQALCKLAGDKGAASLLTGVPVISLDPELGFDVDTLADLARAQDIHAKLNRVGIIQ